MKFNKLTTTKATGVLVTAGEAAVGFAGSNAAVNALDSMVNNKMASKVTVAVIGILGAIAIPNKHLQAVSAGMVAKQAYDGAKSLVEDHASDVAILKDAFEIESAPAETSTAMAALRRASMGNPGSFKMGSPLRTPLKFVAG